MRPHLLDAARVTVDPYWILYLTDGSHLQFADPHHR
jgi:hypothetical protein